MPYGEAELQAVLTAEGEPFSYLGKTYYALVNMADTWEPDETGGQTKIFQCSIEIAPGCPAVRTHDVVTLRGRDWKVADTQRLDDAGLIRLFLRRT